MDRETRVQDMPTLCRECARICLTGQMDDSMDLLCDVVQERLLAQGLLPGTPEEIREMFIRELLMALLNQANAIYGYPYADRDLCVAVLPVWTRLFERLARPVALVEAFMAYYASQYRFPLPGQILGALPSSALASRRGTTFENEGGTITPGYGKKICEELKHKCQILKFRSLRDREQCELPVIESAGGE